jgi:hypothetical protein
MRWRLGEGQCNQFQVMPHNLGKPTYSDALQWAHVLHNVMDAGVHLFDRQVTPAVSEESWTSTEGEEGGGGGQAVGSNGQPPSPESPVTPHLPGPYCCERLCLRCSTRTRP